VKIGDIAVGQSARVVRFGDGDRAYRQTLIQMGMTKGATFKVLRKAPLGDPVEIDCGGVLLTLRRSESTIVEVEAL
jgi:ferrous iron transport protein A